MKDQKTLAYINLFGILGALGKLAELDDAARALLTGIKPISLGIAVSGGPHATLRFADGGCVQTEGVDRCDIKLAFSTAEKFNGMIDGTVTPIPRKGFTHIGFLTGTFVKLTDILTRYLRPSAEDLADERFFEVSTTLMLYVIAGAVAQIGNHDEVGASRPPTSSTATCCFRSRAGRRPPSRPGTMSSPSAARGRRTRAR